MILRDRDTTGNGTLDERVYHLQNWRSDVVALISAAGTQIEQVRYEPYGTPFGIPAGDTNADGDVTSGDVSQVTTWYSTSAYDIRGDLDMDGVVSISDVAYVAGNEYLGHSTGRGELSLVANRKGYAGYENLAELEASGTKWDVRNRVLISEIGTKNQLYRLGSAKRGDNLFVREVAWPESRLSTRSQAKHHIIAFNGFLGAGGTGSDQNPQSGSHPHLWWNWLKPRVEHKRVTFRAYKQIQVMTAVNWAEEQAEARMVKEDGGRCYEYADTFSTIGWSMGGKAAIDFAHIFGRRSRGVMFGVSLDPVPRGIQLLGGIIANNMHAPEGVDWANWYQRKCHFMGRSVAGARIDREFANDELPPCAGATAFCGPHSWMAVPPLPGFPNYWTGCPSLDGGSPTSGNQAAFQDWWFSVKTSPDGIRLQEVPCNGPGGGPSIRPGDATISANKTSAEPRPIGPGGPPL